MNFQDDTIKSTTPNSKSYRLLAEIPVKVAAQKKGKSLEIEAETEIVQEKNHNKLPDAGIDLPEKVRKIFQRISLMNALNPIFLKFLEEGPLI